MFGAYMSKDFNGTRLKLDIKPGVNINNQPQKSLFFNFNFHKDLSKENSFEELKYLIENNNLFENEARKIIENINNE